jgi:hypothetical protein
LHDGPPTRQRTWNQIPPEERDKVLEIALLFPDWSPRQVSCHITDTAGFSISASSVYRILKREGLIHEVQQKTLPAGAEYRVKTSRPNQQWQTDATYLLVKNWGWYCRVSLGLTCRHPGYFPDRDLWPEIMAAPLSSPILTVGKVVQYLSARDDLQIHDDIFI